MQLARFIHQRWQAAARLTQLVPPERLITESARQPTVLPYTVLAFGSRQPIHATSSGTRLHRATVEFRLWAADLETIEQLSAAIRATFDRVDGRLDDGELSDLRFSGSSELEQVDDAWHIRLQYAALLQVV